MEKIKKWKHHFRGIVHKILLNAKDKTLPIAFSPMEHYLDGFDFEYYNFDPNEEELNIDGSYEIEDGRIIRIFVATDVPRSRQRFTIAHEFCHIIQLYDGEFMADMEAIADPTERENIIERIAEMTASYYLAPLPLIQREYQRAVEEFGHGYALPHLTNKFAVSHTMMSICLSDYGLQKQ
ncbi:hypothetical protein A3C17_04630 [Candidatus Uhrbacteria bacterium RIFCSPHIGHO2_02_FULL_53_13]|uniref:IrrE N-terminal-like domain-containing protein n=1 Tax=Candidatus Uhrbacteria bacterium RIFCSPHIGHO2_02_FULL_53_13 TaxID=1802389 RepID=A0A1F7U188_9BACT|nr:MAG: hypothetical protein A3C17_04630 [Candidatus Uhrbacteria bacterium RIFCSPHIGHO2_02_FULL_53_13]